MVLKTDEIFNAYDVLQIHMHSSDAEIQQAYRKRSLKVHPDKVCLFLISVFIFYKFILCIIEFE